MSKKLNICIGIKNTTIPIYDYIDSTETFVDKKGYIDRKTQNIYVFSENGKLDSIDIPMLYIDNNGKVCKKALSDATLKLFHMDNTYVIPEVDTIISVTSGDEVLYNEEALNNINAVMSTFVPVINADDDPLKKIVKYAIIQKGVNINTLRHKIGVPYQLTNMRSALCGKTKMSIMNFSLWAELLDFEFDFVIRDRCPLVNDKIEFPMNKIISYDSGTGKVDIEDESTDDIVATYF